MVFGLEKFKEYFKEFSNQYVLIGGTACDLLMEEIGQPFRATNDFDMVIIIENLEVEFIDRMFKFLEDGGYQNREKTTGQEQFYRFSNPSNNDYPKMIELFSRKTKNNSIEFDDNFTRIECDNSVVSLSAILLNEAYYESLLLGRKIIDGLSIINAEVMILFKLRAWLDLKEKREKGMPIQMNDIRKHRNDVFRLLTIISPEGKTPVEKEIHDDILLFVDQINLDKPDLKSLGIPGDYQDLIDLILTKYLVINEDGLENKE